MQSGTWKTLAALAATAVALLGLNVGLLAAQERIPTPQPVKPAPPVWRLTLEDARQRAMANNRALTLARLNVSEKQIGTVAARKDYFPKLLGNVTYFHFDKPLGTVLTTQGAIFPATPVNVNVFNQDSTLSTIMVAEPITKLIAVNALVQLANADENIARAKLDAGARELLSGVTQLYYGLLGARRIEAALRLQARLLEQLSAGRPNPELRIALVQVQQGLLQVRGQSQELADQLTSLLEVAPCTVLELVDPLPPQPPARCAEEAAQLALAYNPDVREAEQNVAKANAALQIAKMDYLPDVMVMGGYANQTAANYIQDNFAYLGLTANYTFWDWGKRTDVKRQRETTVSLAQHNLQVTREKVEQEARKTYGAFEQASGAYRLADEMVRARRDAEKGARDAAAAMAAKGETAKAELELMKAEIAYRVANAKLMGMLGNP